MRQMDRTYMYYDTLYCYKYFPFRTKEYDDVNKIFIDCLEVNEREGENIQRSQKKE